MKKSVILLLIILYSLKAAISSETTSSTVVSDIENKVVDITSNFNGSELFIFGASREVETSEIENTHGIIIEVIGTTKTRTIRKKEKKLGIWVNSFEEEIVGVPDFYHITSSKNINLLLTEARQKENQVGIKNIIRKQNNDIETELVEALIRIKSGKNLYQFKEAQLAFKDNTLFSTKVILPNNIAEGFYVIKTYLTNHSKITDIDKQLLVVKKVGLGAFLFDMAHNAPFTYGIFSIIVALFSGWIASEVFKRFRS